MVLIFFVINTLTSGIFKQIEKEEKQFIPEKKIEQNLYCCVEG